MLGIFVCKGGACFDESGLGERPETLSLLRQLKHEAGIGRSEGIGTAGGERPDR